MNGIYSTVGYCHTVSFIVITLIILFLPWRNLKLNSASFSQYVAASAHLPTVALCSFPRLVMCVCVLSCACVEGIYDCQLCDAKSMVEVLGNN